MFKRTQLRKFLQKITSAFLIFQLTFFQTLSLILPSVVEAQITPNFDVSYSSSAHQLMLTSNHADETEYRLYYQNGDRLEAVVGQLAREEEIYLGSCSETDCLPAKVERLVVKVNLSDEVKTQRLIIQSGDAIVDQEYTSSDLELSDGESNWLQGKTDAGWIENQDGSFTFEAVSLNKVYQAPQNELVSVTFTQLPNNSGSLRFKEIILNDKQVTDLGALTNIAYEITSDMEDGSFLYDLTLPNPAPETQVEVKYSEDWSTFEDLDGEIQNNETVMINGLNHFTVFTLTGPGGITLGECPGTLADYNVITGTNNNETLSGGPGNDYINAGGGTNYIYGLGGNDCIVGGSGNDTIVTLDGNDVIDAGGGTNNINAGAGNNVIQTGSGNDTIVTGDGDDAIDAGGGTNNITAGEGINPIWTGSGNDTIVTGNGDYDIDAGGGTNNITAGNGNKNITTGSGNDTINIGDGDFEIKAGGGTNHIITGNGNHIITTGNGNDTIVTGNGVDEIRAGGGTNHIETDGGTDYLEGANGNDYLDGGTEDDVCIAGAGNNTLVNCESDDPGDFPGVPSDTTAPSIDILEVSPTELSQDLSKWGGIVGNDLFVRAEVTDPSGVVAVSADFAYTADFSFRPTPTSVAMTNTGGDIYEVTYEIPDTWDSGPLYIKVAAQDGSTSNNYGLSTETEMVTLDNQQLEIIDVSTDKAAYIKNETISLEVKVKNIGQVSITDGRLKIGLDKNGSRISSTDQEYFFSTKPPLAPGAERIILFTQSVADGWNGSDYWYDVAAYGQKFSFDYWYDAINRAVDLNFDTDAPAKPSWGAVYTGHGVVSANEIGCGGYTSIPETTFEWNLNGESDIAGYWFGTKFNDHHEYFSHPDNVKIANMTPGNNPYYYTIIAVDTAGNESEISSQCSLTLDQETPVSTISTPAGGTYFSGPITITGNTTDDYGVDLVTLASAPYADSCGSYTDFTTLDNTVDNNDYNWTYDWTPTTEGSYCIKAYGTDLAGNIESSAVVENVTYDTTAPGATKWTSSPFFTRLGDLAGAKVSMMFEENPASDVDYYEYQYRRADLDGSNLGTNILNMNTYGSGISCSAGVCTWTVGFSDGAINVHRFRAVDLAGNVSPWSNWDGFDISTAGANDFEYEDFINSTGIFADASYVVGNGGFAIREQVLPTSDITSPTSVYTTSNPSLTIDYTANDADTEVKKVELWYDYEGNGYSLLNTDSLVSGSFNPTLTDGDGTYCFNTIAEDIADDLILDSGTGNREAAKICVLEVELDTTYPTSEITNPADGSSNTVYLNDWDGVVGGTADDDNSGVAKVWLSIQRDDGTGDYWNGTGWQAAEVTFETTYDGNTNSEYDWTYDFLQALINNGLDDGGEVPEDFYLATSHAEDNAGNLETTSQLTIIVDRTIPEVDLTIDPTNPDGSNGWYKTQPTITLTATDNNDPNHGFAQIEYQWDSQTGSWTTSANQSVSFNPPSEGHHILYYRALDKSGNYSDIGIKNVRYDSEGLEEGPLNVSVSPNPTSGTTATVSWDAASDGITIDKYEVIWQLDGTSTQYSKTVNSTTFETEIDQLIEGIWTIKVKAYDGVGNSKEASVKLTVDRSAPAAPTLVLDGTGVGTASLSWNAVDGAEEYLIFYGTTSGNYVYGANVGNVTSYTVQGLGAGTYFFIVRAKDAAHNQSPNSNEVSTGAITGTPGVEPGGPAEGFVPAGEVQGATTSEEEPGEVLGVAQDISLLKLNLPWILLLLQLLIILLVDYLTRRKHSMVKHLIAVLVTAVSIGLFTWLVSPEIYTEGTVMAFVVKLFAWISIGLMIFLRGINFVFIEEATN